MRLSRRASEQGVKRGGDCAAGFTIGTFARNFNAVAKKIFVAGQFSGIVARLTEAVTAAGAVTFFAIVRNKLPNGGIRHKWPELRQFCWRVVKIVSQICEQGKTGDGMLAS